MNHLEVAFTKLWPEKPLIYDLSIIYSRKFKPYNANIRLYKNQLTVNLSAEWRQVNEDIVIGLIQSLLLRLFKGKKETIELDLYNNFIKRLHLAVPKDDIDPSISKAFDSLNELFFSGLLEKPNLVWGNPSTTKLGSYEYAQDTITLSTILQDHPELRDYVLYHEMLHKQLQYKGKLGRTRYHTAEFRRLEKQFPNQQRLEQELQALAKRKKFNLRKLFGF